MYKKQGRYISFCNIAVSLLYKLFLSFLLPIYSYADAYSPSKESDNDLHIAIKQGNIDAVKSLLKDPTVDVNAKDSYGQHPLHWAAYKGHVEIVKALLNTKGIQVNEKNYNGQTALDIARENNHSACVSIIEQALKGIDK